MNRLKLLTLSVIVALLAYLSLWPVPIEPKAWQAPIDQGYVDQYATNNALAQLQRLPFSNEGPETIAVSESGVLAAGFANGDIGTIINNQLTIINNTGGRPLGLAYNPEGTLYIADAHLGLLSLSPQGKLTKELTEVADAPIGYANSVAIADDGTVYLSESTTHFAAKEVGVYQGSLLDINEHDGSGRIIGFSPKNKQAELLLTGLNFANGVALTCDNSALIIAETGSYRVHKLHLTGARSGQSEVLLDNLPGFPDNLWHDNNGTFWLGLVAPRNGLLDAMADKPQLRKLTERLPQVLRPTASRYGHLIGFNQDGKILHNLQDPKGGFAFITGAVTANHRLYVSSLHEHSIASIPWPPK